MTSKRRRGLQDTDRDSEPETKKASRWEEKYDVLLSRRTTEVEDRLLKAQEAARKLEEDSDALIARMQKKMDKLKEEKDILEQQIKEMKETTKHHSPPENTINNPDINEASAFYSLFTGIDVKFKGKKETTKTFECHFSNGPKGKGFLLHYNGEDQVIEYNPEIPDVPAAKSRKSIGRALHPFPEFMKEDLYFDANEAPRFLFRILRSVHENML